MNKQLPTPHPCRSVFREGSAAAVTEKYTQLWTALINQMERSRKTLAGAK